MPKIDVVLVTPPNRLAVYQGLSNDLAAIEPPVWSGLIAAYLEARGFRVAMIDAEAEGLPHMEAASTIADMEPQLAVFCIFGQQPSASTQCIPGGSKTCMHLNDIAKIPSLVLGTHPSALPERTLAEEPFDFVCQGELRFHHCRIRRHESHNHQDDCHKYHDLSQLDQVWCAIPDHVGLRDLTITVDHESEGSDRNHRINTQVNVSTETILQYRSQSCA